MRLHSMVFEGSTAGRSDRAAAVLRACLVVLASAAPVGAQLASAPEPPSVDAVQPRDDLLYDGLTPPESFDQVAPAYGYSASAPRYAIKALRVRASETEARLLSIDAEWDVEIHDAGWILVPLGLPEISPSAEPDGWRISGPGQVVLRRDAVHGLAALVRSDTDGLVQIKMRGVTPIHGAGGSAGAALTLPASVGSELRVLLSNPNVEVQVQGDLGAVARETSDAGRLIVVSGGQGRIRFDWRQPSQATEKVFDCDAAIMVEPTTDRLRLRAFLALYTNEGSIPAFEVVAPPGAYWEASSGGAKPSDYRVDSMPADPQGQSVVRVTPTAQHTSLLVDLNFAAAWPSGEGYLDVADWRMLAPTARRLAVAIPQGAQLEWGDQSKIRAASLEDRLWLPPEIGEQAQVLLVDGPGGALPIRRSSARQTSLAPTYRCRIEADAAYVEAEFVVRGAASEGARWNVAAAGWEVLDVSAARGVGAAAAVEVASLARTEGGATASFAEGLASGDRLVVRGRMKFEGGLASFRLPVVEGVALESASIEVRGASRLELAPESGDMRGLIAPFARSSGDPAAWTARGDAEAAVLRFSAVRNQPVVANSEVEIEVSPKSANVVAAVTVDAAQVEREIEISLTPASAVEGLTIVAIDGVRRENLSAATISNRRSIKVRQQPGALLQLELNYRIVIEDANRSNDRDAPLPVVTGADCNVQVAWRWNSVIPTRAALYLGDVVATEVGAAGAKDPAPLTSSQPVDSARWSVPSSDARRSQIAVKRSWRQTWYTDQGFVQDRIALLVSTNLPSIQLEAPDEGDWGVAVRPVAETENAVLSFASLEKSNLGRRSCPLTSSSSGDVRDYVVQLVSLRSQWPRGTVACRPLLVAGAFYDGASTWEIVYPHNRAATPVGDDWQWMYRWSWLRPGDLKPRFDEEVEPAWIEGVEGAPVSYDGTWEVQIPPQGAAARIQLARSGRPTAVRFQIVDRARMFGWGALAAAVGFGGLLALPVASRRSFLLACCVLVAAWFSVAPYHAIAFVHFLVAAVLAASLASLLQRRSWSLPRFPTSPSAAPDRSASDSRLSGFEPPSRAQEGSTSLRTAGSSMR